MSLTSSLYTGTSGLGNTSEALQVTSNNIANINTVAYKKGSTTFADTLYQTIGTQSGAAQVGLGMSVNSVTSDFSTGSVETTTNSTDLAIDGDGFFIVSQAGSDEVYYTRAGNFSFDESGALVNASGYILQGWEVDEDGDAVGAITDLILSAFTSSPDETEEITVVTNLDSDSDSNTEVLSNVYEYDEDDEDSDAVSSDDYEYQTVVTVYDSLGSAHELTIYYDKLSDTTWEYTIVCEGSEDARELLEGTTAQGLLARGTITFSESSGEIVSMTMEELTGRVGNVESVGANDVDDINFEIEDSDAMLVDGYGISLTFDGDDWVLDTASLPDAYANATVLYSDENEIQIVLDPDSSGGEEEADLVITLDQTAMAGDTLSFDINDSEDLAVQDLENIAYGNEAYNNTTVSINDASVMTTSVEDISILWNPTTETWQWSNPEDAAEAGTLVTGLDTNSTSAVTVTSSAISITNAEDLTINVEDVDLRYNATLGTWDWNEDLRDDDITDLATSLAEDNEVTMEITTVGDEGAVATTSVDGIVLEWDGTSWAVTDDGGLNVTILTSGNSSTEVDIVVWDSSSAGASTIEYTFEDALTTAAGQTLSFDIDPSPPAEYGDAEIVATADDSVAIDFDADGTTDLTINVTSGATTALAGGESLSFDIDCDVPPSDYADATLSGDDTEVVIDLDGSGGDDDDEDIVFTFEEALSAGDDTDPYEDQTVITFDIEGSTAWREVTADEAEETGYYQFTTDFLGGDAGSTETDISFNIGSEWDGNNWVNSSLSTTQYAQSSSTTYQDADGYPPGDLTSVEVDSDGVVYGSYSNGQEIALFKVALADFNNANGLQSEGGNLYSETTDSGSAITNAAGENGLGELNSYTLELSNVDISDEFVSMIELQNAYEANAKVITTVDEMMDTVISMKR